MSIDITGPHPRSRDGNEFILTVMDSFTKWAEAIPIRSHTAQVVARKLVENVFARYGTPLRLLSDQGPEFESALMAEMCRAFQIEKVRTTSYKPSTNGAVERFHRTLNSMLGKVVDESQRDWDHRLYEVMAAYRSTVHQSTGFSPNFLVYGRENRAPIDLVLAVSDEPDGVGTSPDEFVNEMLDRKRRAYDLVRRNLGKAAERRKKDYDVNVRTKSFKRGQWVWYFYPRRYRGKSPKWARHYQGPFLIVREMPPCNFVIQRSARSKPIVCHTDKLKEYGGEPPPSWIDDGSDLPVTEGSPSRQDVAPAESAQVDVTQPPTGAADVDADDDRPGVDAHRAVDEKRDDVSRNDRTDSPPQSRRLRDRGQLRRPARMRD
jgi:transposase InsO family protein